MCLTHSKYLTVHRKGVADEELARKEAERDRKRQSASDGFSDMERNRSRSSSFSSSSVSTISTNLSRSPSPRRSSVAQAAHPQNLRRERMSTSPQVRETYRTRHPDPDHGSRKRRRKSRSTSDSSPSDTYTRRRRRERSQEDNRSTRRRHSSVSPDVRGRDRSIPRMKSKRTRSRSKSRDRSRIARNRQSMTPPNRPLHQPVNGGESYPHADTYSGERRPGSNNDDGGRIDRNVQEDSNFGRQRPVTVPPRKERSLSPFSKRLALTQAMNLGSR